MDGWMDGTGFTNYFSKWDMLPVATAAVALPLLLHCCCTVVATAGVATAVALLLPLLLHCCCHCCCTVVATAVALLLPLLLHCCCHCCCTVVATAVALLLHMPCWPSSTAFLYKESKGHTQQTDASSGGKFVVPRPEVWRSLYKLDLW